MLLLGQLALRVDHPTQLHDVVFEKSEDERDPLGVGPDVRQAGRLGRGLLAFLGFAAAHLEELSLLGN
jgi:hypothetical protein